MNALEQYLEDMDFEYDRFQFEHMEEEEDIANMFREEVGVDYSSKYRTTTWYTGRSRRGLFQ